MIVYHGASKIIQKPQIILSEIGREFGVGFYVTAERGVAVQNARLAAKKGFIYDNPKPILNVYELDVEWLTAEFSVIRLEKYSKQWLDFVLQCYTDIHFVHPYDAVFGNAVTAEVREALSLYRHGKISEAEILARLSDSTAVEQICFSTAAASELLCYRESISV